MPATYLHLGVGNLIGWKKKKRVKTNEDKLLSILLYANTAGCVDASQRVSNAEIGQLHFLDVKYYETFSHKYFFSQKNNQVRVWGV